MDDGSARIELRRKSEPSMWALVDQSDLDRLQEHDWHAVQGKTTWYARTTHYQDGSRVFLWMHRFILEPPAEAEVDHVDHYGLNNQRSNLRIATRTQNMRNARPPQTIAGRAATSRYKGVSWDKARSAWRANINVARRQEALGRHATEVEAAIAYDRRARELFGAFALLNFPDGLPDVA